MDFNNKEVNQTTKVKYIGSAEKIFAQKSSDKDLKRMKRDIIKHPKHWGKTEKMSINAELKQRGIRIKPQKSKPKKRATTYNPFGIPRGLF